MRVNDIINIISSVGFPIAACVAIFWWTTKRDTEYRQLISDLMEQSREEYNLLTESINNNTAVLKEIAAVTRDGKQ